MQTNSDPLAGLYADEEDDPLAGLYADESSVESSMAETKPESSISDMYKVQEIPRDQLKNMSVEDRMQYAQDLNTQREFLTGQGLAKGALSGATFGASQYVDALKPKEEEYGFGVGEAAASIIPISGIYSGFSKPLVSMAQKSPYFQKSLTAVGRILVAGLTGATEETGKQVGKSIANQKLDIDPDKILEKGTEWALVDSALGAFGYTARFAKNLFSGKNQSGKEAFQKLEDITQQLMKEGIDFNDQKAVANRALELAEQGIPKTSSLAGRVKVPTQEETKATADLLKSKKKIEQAKLDNLQVREPQTQLIPEDLNFKNISQKLRDEAVSEKISSLGEKAKTKQELGQNVQADIESELQLAKEKYRPAYQLAEEAAKNLSHVPQETASLALSILRDMEKLKTKPDGYAKVKQQLEDILTDIGYNIQRDENGFIKDAILERDTNISKSMELGRRLNEIVDYEALDWTVKDKLKPVVRSLKSDIRSGLEQSPEAYELWVQAEKDFGDTASRFGRDSIRKIRKQESSEKIFSMIREPTVLDDLRGVLSKDQMAQVEIELLDHLNTLPESKAEAVFKEIKPKLSQEARSAGEEILASKIPQKGSFDSETVGRMTDYVHNQLTKSMLTGEIPKGVTDLYKTENGRALVKHIFKDHPNKDKILGYIQEQSFVDLLNSVTKDGKIDFGKAKKFLNSKPVLKNIEDIGGKDAANFVKQLDILSREFEKNMGLSKKILDTGKFKKSEYGLQKIQRFRDKAKATQEAMNPKTSIENFDDWFEGLGVNTRVVISYLLGGFVPRQAAVAGLVGYKAVMNMVKSPKAREAFRKAAQAGARDPKKFVAAMEALDKSMEEND